MSRIGKRVVHAVRAANKSVVEVGAVVGAWAGVAIGNLGVVAKHFQLGNARNHTHLNRILRTHGTSARTIGYKHAVETAFVYGKLVGGAQAVAAIVVFQHLGNHTKVVAAAVQIARWAFGQCAIALGGKICLLGRLVAVPVSAGV